MTFTAGGLCFLNLSKSNLNNRKFFSSQRTVQETKGWDVFRDPPIKVDSGSMANQACE